MRFGAPLPRLFVTAPLPAHALPALIGAQPAPRPDIRLIPRDEMHITLHYLGEAATYSAADALRALSAEVVGFAIRGVGRFVASDGTVTLWAGVEDPTEVSRLHAEVAAALAPTGFRTDIRPFVPHISLAKCERTVPTSVVDAFLADTAAVHHPGVTLDAIALCSMAFVAGVARYRREASFPLRRQTTPA